MCSPCKKVVWKSKKTCWQASFFQDGGLAWFQVQNQKIQCKQKFSQLISQVGLWASLSCCLQLRYLFLLFLLAVVKSWWPVFTVIFAVSLFSKWEKCLSYYFTLHCVHQLVTLSVCRSVSWQAVYEYRQKIRSLHRPGTCRVMWSVQNHLTHYEYVSLIRAAVAG